MFTGDRSGDWLFRALYQSGFANRPTSSHARDGLRLTDARISAIVHCAPPGNLPERAEILACRPFLETELQMLSRLRVVVVLGGLALRGFLDAWEALGHHVGRPRPSFGHGRTYRLAHGPWLVTSYHPSQQNTFTKRLTRPMLHSVFRQARRLIGT